MEFKLNVVVTLKGSVLDPQGVTIKEALHHMNYDQVKDVRLGKFIEMTVEAKTSEEAQQLAHETCKKLLVNQVIETYSLTLVSQAGEVSV